MASSNVVGGTAPVKQCKTCGVVRHESEFLDRDIHKKSKTESCFRCRNGLQLSKALRRRNIDGKTVQQVKQCVKTEVERWIGHRMKNDGLEDEGKRGILHSLETCSAWVNPPDPLPFSNSLRNPPAPVQNRSGKRARQYRSRKRNALKVQRQSKNATDRTSGHAPDDEDENQTGSENATQQDNPGDSANHPIVISSDDGDEDDTEASPASENEEDQHQHQHQHQHQQHQHARHPHSHSQCQRTRHPASLALHFTRSGMIRDESQDPEVPDEPRVKKTPREWIHGDDFGPARRRKKRGPAVLPSDDSQNQKPWERHDGDCEDEDEDEDEDWGWEE